ncbi:MAG: hypothetical protein EKK42_20135 [Pseudonocardiaceae bacterium]|nr:MAG: hypothetical protein EKK42_20135 [Pseudonocardiaceae bacterium]
MTLVFDIESHSADERFTLHPDEFFRVGGLLVGDEYRVSTDVEQVRSAVARAPLSVGHNVFSFDLAALGVDTLALARDRRLLDTMVLDALTDPPDFNMKPEQAMKQKYKLDRACARHGIPGKQGDLAALAKRFKGSGHCPHDCGYGEIPTDDPDYRTYLEGDLRATDALLERVTENGVSDYAWREMRVAALGSVMSDTGWLLDRELLDVRVGEAADRRRELIDWLVSEHQIPTTLPNGKPAKAPQSTKAGKQAIVDAFASVGVSESELPHTEKGAVSLKGDLLAELADQFDEFPRVRELCDAVAALVGVRSVYDTAAKYLRPDGRVHPDVTFFQASGRSSITKPGLTVFGKRGGRKVERDVFAASPGHVLLSADLSQVDARAVAAHSGDPAYIALFEPGKDSHILTAYMVWGRDVVEASDESRVYYRNKVKAITHGTTYGMGVPKLAASAGVPDSEAQRVVDTLREQFPGVERWKMQVREQAEAGEMLDNGFGRIMRPNPERAWTQGPALMGQGTARDILMEGIAVRMPLDVQRMIRGIVHDEVVVECPAADVEEVRQVVIDSMSFEWCPPWMSEPVQFVADCSPAPGALRWSGCY